MEYVQAIKKAFKNCNSKELRRISNKILAKGFVERNKKLIRLAVVSHSLSKICEKEYYKKKKKYWEKFVGKITSGFDQVQRDAKKIRDVEKTIVGLDENLGRYKENIIHHSKIRAGSTLYAWGVSLTLASELVEIPEYELMKHIGSTKIVDEEGLGVSVSERLKNAEELL